MYLTGEECVFVENKNIFGIDPNISGCWKDIIQLSRVED